MKESRIVSLNNVCFNNDKIWIIVLPINEFISWGWRKQENDEIIILFLFVAHLWLIFLFLTITKSTAHMFHIFLVLEVRYFLGVLYIQIWSHCKCVYSFLFLFVDDNSTDKANYVSSSTSNRLIRSVLKLSIEKEKKKKETWRPE